MKTRFWWSWHYEEWCWVDEFEGEPVMTNAEKGGWIYIARP